MPRWTNKYFYEINPQYREVALILAENPETTKAPVMKLYPKMSPYTLGQMINRIRQEAGIATFHKGPASYFGVADETMFREFCESLGVTPKPGKIYPEKRHICVIPGCWRLAVKPGGPCCTHYRVHRESALRALVPPDSVPPDSVLLDSASLDPVSPDSNPNLAALLRRLQKVMKGEQIERICLFASGEVEIDRTVKQRTKSKI